jgi:hypothetical protein
MHQFKSVLLRNSHFIASEEHSFSEESKVKVPHKVSVKPILKYSKPPKAKETKLQLLKVPESNSDPKKLLHSACVMLIKHKSVTLKGESPGLNCSELANLPIEFDYARVSKIVMPDPKSDASDKTKLKITLTST